DVLSVLADLGVTGETTPIIEVWNKIDNLPADADLSAVTPTGKVAATVPVSAMTGQGVDTLLAAIEKALAQDARLFSVLVPHDSGSETGWLDANTVVIVRDPADSGTRYTVRVVPRHRAEFLGKFAGRMTGVDA